jgi:hypothetical protein
VRASVVRADDAWFGPADPLASALARAKPRDVAKFGTCRGDPPAARPRPIGRARRPDRPGYAARDGASCRPSAATYMGG